VQKVVTEASLDVDLAKAIEVTDFMDYVVSANVLCSSVVD